MESAICNKLGSRECPCQMTNSNVQSCHCKMRYSTKYTVRKLFSKPYFPHPFEIIPINQEDIIKKIPVHSVVACLTHNHPKTLVLPQASLQASAYRSSTAPLPTSACYPLETYWCALQ